MICVQTLCVLLITTGIVVGSVYIDVLTRRMAHEPRTVNSTYKASPVELSFPTRVAVHVEDSIAICVMHKEFAVALGMDVSSCDPPCSSASAGRRLLRTRASCVPARIAWDLTIAPRSFEARARARVISPDAAAMAAASGLDFRTVFARSACEGTAFSPVCNATSKYAIMCQDLRNFWNGSCSVQEGATRMEPSPAVVANGERLTMAYHRNDFIALLVVSVLFAVWWVWYFVVMGAQKALAATTLLAAAAT